MTMSDWDFKTVTIASIGNGLIKTSDGQTFALTGKAKDNVGLLKTGKARIGVTPDGLVGFASNDTSFKGKKTNGNGQTPQPARPADMSAREFLSAKQTATNKAVEIELALMQTTLAFVNEQPKREDLLKAIKTTARELYQDMSGREW